MIEYSYFCIAKYLHSTTFFEFKKHTIFDLFTHLIL